MIYTAFYRAGFVGYSIRIHGHIETKNRQGDAKAALWDKGGKRCMPTWLY